MPAPAFDIKKTFSAGTPVPALPYEKMACTVLGGHFELSLVLCGDRLARRMNIAYRKKTYSPNVLSFPLSKNEGEIFLNVRKAEREAQQFGVPVRERLALLFVHGCFHLKGLRHGRIMEGEEQRILRAFNFHAKKDLHGNRHRHLPRQGSHRSNGR